jgi:hypothetical protein
VASQESSFDIVSKLDRQEVDNALNQAAKEISTRFDFRGVGASITWSGEQVDIRANSEERANAVLDVFRDKLVKRGVSPKTLDAADPKLSGREYRLGVALKEASARTTPRSCPRSSGTRGRRASGLRSRARSFASRPRRRTTCRRSSACSRARSSTSPCSSSTTGEIAATKRTEP